MTVARAPIGGFGAGGRPTGDRRPGSAAETRPGRTRLEFGVAGPETEAAGAGGLLEVPAIAVSRAGCGAP